MGQATIRNQKICKKTALTPKELSKFVLKRRPAFFLFKCELG